MTETSSAEHPIDLPTGEPIPAPSPSLPSPSPSVAPSKPSSSKHTAASLTALLRSVPANADPFLQHLQRCLATPGGIDTTLLFLCYTARLSSALLHSLSQFLLRRSARDLVAFMFTLPPKTTILFTTTTASSSSSPVVGGGAAAIHPVRTLAAQLAALWAARLKNLGSLASEARTIARLWALLGMYFWAKRLTQDLFSTSKKDKEGESSKSSGSSNNKLTTLVAWTQLISCTAFQYLENGAYLSSRGVLGWTPKEQGRAYVVGARWLAVYTGLELGKLLAEIVAKRQGHGGEKGGVAAETQEDKARMEAVRRSMVINLAWTPLTLHWSTEGGFLGDAAIGLGGCIPGFIQMRKLWRETAQ